MKVKVIFTNDNGNQIMMKCKVGCNFAVGLNLRAYPVQQTIEEGE